MKLQLKSMRIAIIAILMLCLGVFTFSSCFCFAFAENNSVADTLTQLDQSMNTPAPEFAQMEATIDTPIAPLEGSGSDIDREPVPGDRSVHRLEEQPDAVSKGVRLYTQSKWWSNLHLNADALSIPEDGMPIPRLYQFNYTTAVCYSGNSERSAESSGCGATVVSMIDAYINGNYDQTPYTVLYDAVRSGRYAGKGLDYFVVFDLVKERGIEIECRDRSVDTMRAELEAGHPLILRMGPGTFTKAGHYILVRGLNADGDALVNDPNNEEHSHTPFSLELLDHETKANDMFVILSGPCANS